MTRFTENKNPLRVNEEENLFLFVCGVLLGKYGDVWIFFKFGYRFFFISKDELCVYTRTIRRDGKCG